jgi:hypothetical protein
MRKIALIAGAALLLITPVHAAGLVSAYTDLDLADCVETDTDEVGATYDCEGLNGMPITVSEGDLRMTVSYGGNARDEPAMGQGFGQFNRLGAKIEWLSPADKPSEPVATILRWYLQQGEGPGESQILVVTQLEPGAICQIAWVDATANPGANELARQAAEELAGGFDCGGMPRVYGEFEAFELE